MRPRTLRGLALSFLTAFQTVIIIVGLSIYVATHDALDREVNRRLAAVATEIVPDGQTVPLATIVDRIETLERQRETRDIGFMLRDRAGRNIAGTISIPIPPSGFSGIDRASRIPGLWRGRALVLPAGDGRTLTMIAESEPIDHFDSSFIRVLLIGFVAIGAMVVIGVLVMIATIARRITELRTVASTIIEGDITGRVRTDASGSEFDETAMLLNRMLDRIQQLMEGIRHVAHDAAHDLRTPLARLRGRLAALVRTVTGGPLETEVEAALRETDDALALLAAILRIAEIDSAAGRAHFVRVDIVRLIDDLATAYRPTIEDERRTFDLVADGSSAIEGDRQLLNQLFANLIENWLIHTDLGTPMTVKIARQHAKITIVMSDRGVGIAVDQRAAALQRFHRFGTAMGYGIGLPLVAAIVRLHRGELALEDARPGLAVEIRLPAWQAKLPALR